MSAQLDLFLDNSEDSLNRRELAAIRDLILRSNRAQFAKLGSFGKEIIALHEEIDRLRGMLVKSC
jgi:hypothetical protein